MAAAITFGRRIAAGLGDFAVVFVWIAFAIAVGALTWRLDLRPESPWTQDALAFCSLVLPVILSFAWLESGTRRGGPGKRHRALRVTDKHGDPLSFPHALARNAAKFAPWQLAHTGVFWIVATPESSVPLVLAVTAQLLVLANVFFIWRSCGADSLHDRVAGTRLVAE